MKDVNTTKKAKRANKKEFKKTVAKSLSDSLKQVKGKQLEESGAKKKYNGFKKLDKNKPKQSYTKSLTPVDKTTLPSKDNKVKKPFSKFVKKEFKPIFKDTVYDKSKTKLYNSKKPNTQLVIISKYIIK